mmetsp:Transcript_13976/g.31727  ORF Transcript_13976/g.31727 Transcript_13976/m.31727 type:complete len:133 (+) Transcript_13976:274-672(+)
MACGSILLKDEAPLLSASYRPLGNDRRDQVLNQHPPVQWSLHRHVLPLKSACYSSVEVLCAATKSPKCQMPSFPSHSVPCLSTALGHETAQRNMILVMCHLFFVFLLGGVSSAARIYFCPSSSAQTTSRQYE